MKTLVALLLTACGSKPTRDEPVTPPKIPVMVDAALASTDAATASIDASVPDLPKVAVEVPVKPDALQTWLIAAHYKAWSHESQNHVSDGPHETVRVFLSPSLVKSLGEKAPEHPVGAAAVKELYTKGKHTGWAVSVKLKAKSDEGKGWYWYEVFSTEPKGKAPYQGVGFRLCRDCHYEGGGSDLVRSLYPLQ
jgi:hypothetical protein